MDGTGGLFFDYCRICASQSNPVQNLFELVHNGMNLAEMLQFCLKRQIKDDGLPANICTVCKNNLISTYEFHNLCEASEQYFLNQLISLNPSNELLTKQNCDIEPPIKSENEYGFDDFDYRIKSDVPTLASELVCVEENFDVSNIFNENGLELKGRQCRRRRNSAKTVQAKKVRLKTEEKVYECYECKSQFDGLNELRTHMHDHDSSRKPFECATCKMRFVHLNSWFRHRTKHTKNIHDCEYCSEAFNTLTALKHHIQNAHKEQMNAYKCNQCSEEFSLHFLLVWHIEWHKKRKPFDCHTCDAVFFSERKLKSHIRDKHATHLCAECGKSFKTIHLLASHQMMHLDAKPFGCDLCPSRFKWKAALKTHMLVHTGQKQHVCDICGSSFTTKGSMKKHKRIHTGDRRYRCETCQMRFYSNDHLKRHKRTHTGERPYLCSYCPRTFSQSNDLTKHIRSHVGQNIYNCHCGASFRLQTELRKHSYTHYNKDESSSTAIPEPASATII